MNANVSKFVVGRPMVIREHWAPEAPGSADQIRSDQVKEGAWQPWSCSVERGEPQPSLPGAGATGLSSALHPASEGPGPFPGRPWAVEEENHKWKSLLPLSSVSHCAPSCCLLAKLQAVWFSLF